METSGLGIIYSCALPDCVTEMVVCGDTPVSGSVQDSVSQWNSETEMGSWFSTALEEELDETLNKGYSFNGSKVVLTFTLPYGASKPNFGFVNVGGGYQPRMRATTSAGRTCGYDFPTMQAEEYRTVSGVSQGTSGNSYKVSFKTGGHDLSRIFQ